MQKHRCVRCNKINTKIWFLFLHDTRITHNACYNNNNNNIVARGSSFYNFITKLETYETRLMKINNLQKTLRRRTVLRASHPSRNRCTQTRKRLKRICNNPRAGLRALSKRDYIIIRPRRRWHAGLAYTIYYNRLQYLYYNNMTETAFAF